MSLPDTKESAAVHPATELERVVLDEMRRLGKAVDALADRMEAKLDALARDMKAADDKLEARVRALEIDAAKSGGAARVWGSLAGIVTGGFVAAIAEALFHHHP